MQNRGHISSKINYEAIERTSVGSRGELIRIVGRSPRKTIPLAISLKNLCGRNSVSEGKKSAIKLEDRPYISTLGG